MIENLNYECEANKYVIWYAKKHKNISYAGYNLLDWPIYYYIQTGAHVVAFNIVKQNIHCNTPTDDDWSLTWPLLANMT